MCPSGCAGHGGRHASQYKRLVYSLILALLASISLGELRNTVYTEFTVSMHERWCHSYWLRCHQTLGLARVQREITADPSQCSDPSESGRQPYQCAHVPRITAWHRKKTGRWCRLQTAQATRCPGLHQPAHAHTHTSNLLGLVMTLRVVIGLADLPYCGPYLLPQRTWLRREKPA